MYTQPKTNIKLEDCTFYHSFNFPDGTIVNGDWDLRYCIKEYLGNINYEGKRVMDVGAASGCLSFEMEKWGADVVSFDMPDGSYWDVLKYPGYIPAKHSNYHIKMYNSYYYAHEKFKSKCKIYHANIYNDLPELLGSFDGAVFGTMLSHVRDPMLVLMNVLYRVKEFAVLINPFPDHTGSTFMPSLNNFERTWWNLSIDTIDRMVSSIGWKIENITEVWPIQNVLLDEPQKRPYKSIVIKRRP
jgi:hypothetical protein